MSKIKLTLLATTLAFVFAARAQEHIAGVGLVLGVQDHAITIRKVLPDTPAAKAGLSAGLMVHAVDGVPAADGNLKQCVDRLRGEAGTKVNLELIDAAHSKTNVVELTREELHLGK